MLKRLLLGLAAMVAASALAFAQDDHDHDGHAHDHEPKHGGVVVHSGHHHLELVAEDGALRLYITDQHGKPETIEGAKATATVLSEGKTEAVALAHAGENRLEGSGSFKAGKGTTVVVTLTLPDHEAEQARFRLD
ncbi:MAG TPA: hypothetical protein PK857_02970 [Hyphomicrobium sp.]|nr:hypothetical protein [Hyphomicrobium sp.]HRO50444.1 hypothetical protein [Hyphomicrobium sp.]